MIHLRRYTADDKSLWNSFVQKSKNGTFLFLRNFMEYHQDRFTDHSLLFFDSKDRLVALLPANETQNNTGKTLASHEGLTYGGLILSPTSSGSLPLHCIESLLAYLKQNRFQHLLYKAVPTIYHRQPAQEDLYALFRYNAHLIACNLSCSIDLKATLPAHIERRRKRGHLKAASLNYSITEGALSDFWPIMEKNLQTRYGTTPVHSLTEMEQLKEDFPEHIRCIVAVDAEQKPQAGALLFVTPQTVHVQYGHATEKGKQDGALDFLYFNTIEEYRLQPQFLYFDFGTSNEQGGLILNENLLAQKEGFGARSIIYPTYRIDLLP